METVNVRRRCIFIIAFLTFVTTLKAANPSTNCRKGCPQSDNGFLKYNAGSVYEYNFDSVLKVQGHGTENDDTGLKVVGTAKVYAEGNCGYTLQLAGVKVTASRDNIEKKLTQSIQKPVHFTLVDGQLEPELCTDANDNEYALNVKRGIISLLQVEPNAKTEVDVFGQCSTYTSVSQVGTTTVVNKVRNLNSCAYREQIHSGIVNGVVNEEAGIHSTQLLQGDYNKEAKIENGIVVSIHLVEHYRYGGVITGGSKNHLAVEAHVDTKLKLKQTGDSGAPASGTQSASIIFQKPDTHTNKNLVALKNQINVVVQHMSDYVQQKSAKHFIELIRLMRNADTESLLELGSVPHANKVLAWQVYLDALFRTGTKESASAVLKQMNKLESKEKGLALLSLNLVQTIDKDIMQQAMNLLNANAPKEVYLVVGGIVNKYCQRHDCASDKVVEGVTKKFVENLKHCRAATRKDEDRIVNILKGVANAGNGYLDSNVLVPGLIECSVANLPARIRVAALQAYSAESCAPQLQQNALQLLRNHNEDSELRIEAYLAAIQCPNAELANHLAEILNKEQVNQVGGFIASHLQTLRDSTDATRQQQRHYLRNVRIPKSFRHDPLRYSHSDEVSYKLAALGIGASVDKKVIFSQQSFLPRSARLNVTTEIFGTNFNVLEAKVRQENIENILEYYLGPKGLLNQDFQDIMKSVRVGNRVRRSIADEAAKLAKKYKNYGSKSDQDIDFDISLKLFGTEMFFLSLGDCIPTNVADLIAQFSKVFDDTKHELSTFQRQFQLHTLFLDTKLQYPTGAGIPLEFALNGFAANQVDVALNLDVNAIFDQNWQNAQHRVQLIPSIDVIMQLKFGFNAYVLETGVNLEASLHSAAGGDITVTAINDGNGVNLAIQLPREKLELINLHMTQDFYIGEQDKPQKLLALKPNSKKQQSPQVAAAPICFNQLESLGFNFCIVAPDFEYTKPGVDSFAETYDLAVYLTSERQINLKAYHVPEMEGGHQWKLEFTTPGSNVPHDTAVSLELAAMPRPHIRLTYSNPEKTLAFESGMNSDNTELVVYVQYEHNNEKRRNRIGFQKNGNEYQPVIEVYETSNGVVRNDISGYRADGRIIVQPQGTRNRYQFDNFQISSPRNERLLINGYVDSTGNSFDSDLHVGLGQNSYGVKSNLQIENGVSVGVFVNDERTPQYIYGSSLAFKLGDSDFSLDVVGQAKELELRSKHTLHYQQNEEEDIVGTQWTNLVSIKRQKQLLLSARLDGTVESHLVQVSGELQQGKRQASIATKWQQGAGADSNNKQQYAFELNGKYNKHFVDIFAKAHLNGNGQRLVVDNVLTTSWGTALSVKGELGQRFTISDVYIDLTGSGQLVGKTKPIQLVLKVVGAPEKTQSDLRLTQDGNELLHYTGEMIRPQDKITNGKFDLNINTVLQLKGECKVAKNGKGELNVVLELQKTEKPHKLEVSSKFHVQAPKYDVDAVLMYDNTQTLHLKTENLLDKQKFSTKNILDFAGKQWKFDANGAVKGEWVWNGEVTGNFVFVTPLGRAIDGNFKRKLQLNAKTSLTHGTIDFQLNESREDGPKRSFIANAKLDQFNWQQRSIVEEMKITYTNFENQQLIFHGNLKNIPTGATADPRQFEFKANIEGSILHRAPINVHVTVNGYNTRQAEFTVAAKHSDIADVNFSGTYSLAQSGQPATFKVVGHVDAPNTQFKTFDLQTDGKLLLPQKNTGSGLGMYQLELHIDERAGDNQFVKVHTVFNGGQRQGSYQLDFHNNAMAAPLKLTSNYQQEDSSDDDTEKRIVKQTYHCEISHGERYVKTNVVVNYSSAEGINIAYSLDTSNAEVSHVRVDVNGHQVSADNYLLNVNAKVNSKEYNLKTELHRATYKNGVDALLTLPEAQPVKVVWIMEKTGERKGKLTMDVANLLDIDLKLNAEASYNDIDNFYYTAQWNSVKLNLRDYDLSVRAQSKTLDVQVKNANGVIMAGTATYALKKEQNKAIIEAQGQLQLGGKAENMNFKLIRQTYNLASDQEVGFSYTLNGNFGAKNGVSTLKVTNKDFNIKLSVCEERKQCTNLQLQSSVTQQQDATHHSLLMLVDLRELGYPYEFELLSKTIRQGFKSQYNLDASIISNNNHKYQLNVLWRHEGGHVVIKLPTRELMFEAKHKRPASLFGNYTHSFKFWFDKANKPEEVTSLVSIADLTGIDRIALNAAGSIMFEHPQLRPLSATALLDINRQKHSVNAEVNLDIFRNAEQQIQANMRWENTVGENGRGFNITNTQTIRSTGLNILYETQGHVALDTARLQLTSAGEVHCGVADLRASYFVLLNNERAQVHVNGFNEQLVELLGEFDRQHYNNKWNAKLQLFGQSPIEMSSEIQPSQAKFALKRANGIDLSGEIKLGKEFIVHIKGNGQELLQGRVALDSANFLQTSYTSNDNEMKTYLETAMKQAKDEATAAQLKIHENLKRVAGELDRQRQLALESVPDFTHLKSNYVQHMNDIAKELEQDEALQKLVQSYGKLTTKLVHLMSEVSKVGVELYENLHKSIVLVHTKLQDILKNIVLPAWEEFLKTSTVVIGELRSNLVVLYTKTVKVLMTSLEKYGPALKSYGKAINEVARPWLEGTQELYKLTTQFVDELINDLKHAVASIPSFEQWRSEFNEQLEKLHIAEKALVVVNDVFAHLHIFPQSAQINEFLQKAQSYLEKKIKQQPVNDEEALEELFNLLTNALLSIWTGVTNANPHVAGSAAANAGISNIGTLFTAVPNLMDLFRKLGQLLTFRFSGLNYVLNENWAHNFKHRLRSWVSGDEFDLHAHVTDGRHMFTFDGQYYNYAANCKYVLAQDSVDNNFTVIGHLNNGKLKSIVLSDRNGNFVEANDVGVLKLNGQNVEYPQHVGDMHAWRRYYVVNLKSEYGVDIICTSDLKVCHVIVNGFYRSKVRGLFGNGNAEPYDDGIKVDGTLASDPSELGNSYGLGKCNPVPAQPTARAEHSEICNDLFGYDSPLITGYFAIKPEVYRDACDSSVSEVAEKDKEAAACSIALTYASAVRVLDNFASVPTRCLKCSGPPTQRDFGSEFSVKIPTNKADVVFVVDLEQSPNVMQNLISPAIREIRETLKARGLTDVQVAVIAYNITERYPALLTSDNGKLNYNGNLADLQLSGPERFCESCFTNIGDVLGDRAQSIQNGIKQLLQYLVPQSEEMAYKLAFKYPFRAAAAKTIIGVHGQPYEYSRLVRLMRTSLWRDADAAVGINLITPVQEVSLEGVPTDRIIGFNSRAVGLLDGKDARKRSKLQFKSNVAFEYVLSNGGWIFTTERFSDLQVPDQKKALSQLTNVIADTLFKTELGNDCKCTSVFGGLHAQHSCVVKSTNFVPNKKVKAVS